MTQALLQQGYTLQRLVLFTGMLHPRIQRHVTLLFDRLCDLHNQYPSQLPFDVLERAYETCSKFDTTTLDTLVDERLATTLVFVYALTSNHSSAFQHAGLFACKLIQQVRKAQVNAVDTSQRAAYLVDTPVDEPHTRLLTEQLSDPLV